MAGVLGTRETPGGLGKGHSRPFSLLEAAFSKAGAQPREGEGCSWGQTGWRGGGSSNPEGTQCPSTSGTARDTPILGFSSPSSSISSPWPCPEPGCFTRQRKSRLFLPPGEYFQALQTPAGFPPSRKPGTKLSAFVEQTKPLKSNAGFQNNILLAKSSLAPGKRIPSEDG